VNSKAEKFSSMLEEINLQAFSVIKPEELDDEFKTVVFRANLEVKGQNLPMLVVTDNSIYTLLRVFVAAKAVTADNRARVEAYLGELNKQYKVFKFYISDIGDIVLDCCMPSSDEHFDPRLVRAIIDVTLQALTDKYSDIMNVLWVKD